MIGARLISLATALPPFRASQLQASRFLARVLRAGPPGEERDRAIDLLEKVCASSGIETRHSVIRDFGLDDPETFRFFPKRWDLDPFPTTAARMRIYETASVDLAAEAGRRALDGSGLEAGAVTHLVLCTCTGFFAPGPDILLLRRLGLRSSVSRVVIGFMGCHGGFNGIRAADQIVRADPEAVVLFVSVELCSLHYQKRPDPGLVVSSSLFADGCAAAVLAAPGRGGPGLADILGTATHAVPDSLESMTWRIGDTGFEMVLDVSVPAALAGEAAPFVADLLRRAGLERSEIGGWATHPGGRKILNALAPVLGLENHDLEASREVLRDCGNMSSATVFFVLERLLRGRPAGGPIVALGFGPGLTLEGAVLVPPGGA